MLNLSNQFPATLNIEPTNICNLDCSFCPVKKTNRAKGFVKLGFYKKVIDQISQQKRLKVLWLNKDGEPLLHPQIDELISYAKKKKVADRIEIYSNGILLDKSMVQKLIKAELDSLVISLDASNRKAFKRLKRKDLYNQIITNINNFLRTRKKLKTKRPLVSAKIVDLGNDKEIVRFKKIWQNKVDDIIIQPLHSWEGSLENTADFQSSVPKSKRYPCNLPWLAPAINWDGTLVPCCVNFKKNELIMGDLKKQSLKEIWQGNKFKKLRQAHLDQDFSQWPTCSHCQYWQQLPNMESWLRRLGA